MQLAQKHGLSKQLGKISCLEQKEKKKVKAMSEKKRKIFGCFRRFLDAVPPFSSCTVDGICISRCLMGERFESLFTFCA